MFYMHDFLIFCEKVYKISVYVKWSTKCNPFFWNFVETIHTQLYIYEKRSTVYTYSMWKGPNKLAYLCKKVHSSKECPYLIQKVSNMLLWYASMKRFQPGQKLQSTVCIYIKRTNIHPYSMKKVYEFLMYKKQLP